MSTDPQLADLIERAKEKFSEGEIENFIKMGKVLTSKSVLSAVIEVVKEGPDARESARLVKTITKRMPYDASGYVSLAFKEIPYTLNVTLSIVEKGYKTDIDIPSADYARDLFTKYDFLKETARAYWRQFIEEHPELHRRICKYRPDVDFSALTVDPENPTTMYFDANCTRRIGIFCYYLDENGQPFYKKSSTIPMQNC